MKIKKIPDGATHLFVAPVMEPEKDCLYKINNSLFAERLNKDNKNWAISNCTNVIVISNLCDYGDFIKIPDAATHYDENSFYKAIVGDMVVQVNEKPTIVGVPDVKSRVDKAWEKPPKVTDKPIYTKEMHEAGELPPVGTECEFCFIDGFELYDLFNDWKSGDTLDVLAHKIGPNGLDVAVVYNKNRHMSCQFIVDLLRPIDTRTDSEKLTEEFQNILHDSLGVNNSESWSDIENITSDLFDKFNISVK